MRAAIIAFGLFLSCGWAQPQSVLDGGEVEETYAKIREFAAIERNVAISGELKLTRSEADAFWPIYEGYRAEIAAFQDRYAALLRRFADRFDDMDDATATGLIVEYFAIRSGMLDVRQRYVPAFLEVMPASKLVSFYQMENKIDAVAELPLVLDVPLLGEDFSE